MNYCIYDNGYQKYFCDFQNKHYESYQECYNSCGLTYNDNIIHISNVDLTFVLAIWAVLLSSLLFYAFHISHD